MIAHLSLTVDRAARVNMLNVSFTPTTMTLVGKG